MSDRANGRAYDPGVVRIASPTFVGRAAELAALDEAFDSAAHGHTTTVLIGGDAGVGKSRLVDTWNERARERGARIAAGSCLDLGESGPAYVALVQALRELLGPMGTAAVDALVGSDRSTLALIIPELSGTGPGSDGQPSTPIAQTRLFDRLVRMLERASADAPVVLEIEDVHWADPSTRAFVIYLVANARHARLLIVATFRAEEAGREQPIASVLRELDRHGATRVHLLPFDADEVREQMHGILGEVPANKLVAAIHGRSEGNALFAEELLASGDPAGELPTSIGAALLSRTAGLSRTAHGVLRMASVAGRSVSYDVLRSTTRLADDLLDAALREVVGANILEPRHVGEHYRFRHALLQEAIYQDTLPGERRRLHAVVADALDTYAGESAGEPGLASELAHHWLEAKDHDRALKASLVAGDLAMHQAGYAEALRHYERVLELWDLALLAHAGVGRVQILERASHSAFLAGEPDNAVAYARRALDELEVMDDAILRVRLLDVIAQALHWTHRHDQAIEYELRLGAIEPDRVPVREQMMVLTSRVRALQASGDPAAGVAALEAMHLADSTDDPELKGDAHMMMAWTLFHAGEFDAAIGEARRAGEFASRAGDAETEVDALNLVYGACLSTGQHEMAITAARAAGAYADQVGLSQWEGPSASIAESQALFELGRITESAEIVQAGLLDPPADQANLIHYHLLAAQASIVQGSYHDAATHLDEARVPDATHEEESRRGWLATVRAELAVSEGRLEDVRAIVDATASLVRDATPLAEQGASIWSLVEIGLAAEAARAEVALAAGDHSQSARSGRSRLRFSATSTTFDVIATTPVSKTPEWQALTKRSSRAISLGSRIATIRRNGLKPLPCSRRCRLGDSPHATARPRRCSQIARRGRRSER